MNILIIDTISSILKINLKYQTLLFNFKNLISIFILLLTQSKKIEVPFTY